VSTLRSHPAVRRGITIPAGGGPHVYSEVAQVISGDVAPLSPVAPGTADRPLRLALIVPPFSFGSGGHQVVFQLAQRLHERGHAVSYWVHDPFGQVTDSAARLRAQIRDQFAAVDGPVAVGFADWNGADVVVATGWQTVYPAMRLPRCRARAYLVNDHEPEFYPTSLESIYAARTYTLGVPCIVGGGPWLADLLRDRYAADVVARFPYPVAAEFQLRDVRRRDDTIVVYARDSTPRRAVGLALMALERLKERRPELRVVLFGDEGMPALPFAYEHLGRITPEDLSWVYSEATVGLGFSLTHGSLVPHDMLACGLPPVDLTGFSMAAEHAATGLVELAAPQPAAIAEAVQQLLDDPAERARRAEAGRAYVARHTWADATDRVEAGLRDVVRARLSADAR
jgi:glycosyltransferase involved in cell wall biosynthesis